MMVAYPTFQSCPALHKTTSPMLVRRSNLQPPLWALHYPRAPPLLRFHLR